MSTKEIIQLLYDKGLSYSDIGKLLNVSRQRVHQLITGYESPSTKRIRLERKQRIPEPRNVGEVKAKPPKEPKGRKGPPTKDGIILPKYKSRKDYVRHNVLVIKGKATVVRKRQRPDDICEMCGKEAHRLGYHHWNDNNPSWGIWVCGQCHFLCNFVERGLHTKYIEMKESIESYA